MFSFTKTYNIVGDALHAKQFEIANALAISNIKHQLVLCGRGFGKTVTLQNVAMNSITKYKAGDKLAIFSPTATLNDESFERMRGCIPIIRKATHHKIVYKNGVTLIFKSFHEPENLRGQNFYKEIFFDEASLLDDVSYEFILKDVLKHPKKIYYFTTPRGINWVKTAIYDRVALEPHRFAYYRGTSLDNPFIDPAETADIREAIAQGLITKSMKQEVLAEFLESGGLSFTGLDNILTLSEFAQPTQENYVGIDYANVSDYSCVVVLNKFGQMVAFERFNRMPWERQVKVIFEMLRGLGGDVQGFMDPWGEGQLVSQGLRDLGLHGIYNYQFNNDSKHTLIENLQLQILLRKLHLPVHSKVPVLVKEMNRFRGVISSSGKMIWGTNNVRDDSVIAFALAALRLKRAQA